MQAVHELGHVLGAWLTGGHVARVVLYPLTISQTDLDDNPSPLFVVWAGPVGGILMPLLFWAIAGGLRMPGASFCGSLPGSASLPMAPTSALVRSIGNGDCGEMLRYGSPIWQLWLFGAITMPAGLWLWHGQGPNFGLGTGHGKVHPGVAYASLAVFVLLLVVGFVVDGR